MNCIQPSAPAEDGPRLVPKAVSTALIPARIAGPCGPSPYRAEARGEIGISTGGTPLIAQLEAGSEGIAKVPGLGAGLAPAGVSVSAPPAPLPLPAPTPPLGGGVWVAGGGGGTSVAPCLTVGSSFGGGTKCSAGSGAGGVADAPGAASVAEVEGASSAVPRIGAVADSASARATATGTASAAVAATVATTAL